MQVCIFGMLRAGVGLALDEGQGCRPLRNKAKSAAGWPGAAINTITKAKRLLRIAHISRLAHPAGYISKRLKNSELNP